MARLFVKVLAATLLISGSAAATMRTIAKNDDLAQTLVPHPPRGQGKHCVAPTDFMRRYHMTMLMHHRAQVVHLGIRTEQYDLNRCISCHAVRGTDGKFVSYASPKHFCRSCHDYAAVSLDCFECHASRPAEPVKSAALSGHSALAAKSGNDNELAALTKYLREAKR